jgi:lipoprotein-anchoring transpeptidase ErfK/SrfK
MNNLLNHLESLSRRDFLKYLGLGFFIFTPARLASLSPSQLNSVNERSLLPQPASLQKSDEQAKVLGRVVESGTGLYEKPTYSSNKIKTLWTDVVMPITDVTVGDQVPDYNRVWYNLDGQGYVHSGSVQPVQVILNDPGLQVPEGGQLGEITVPFTDARWWVDSPGAVAYRLYYGTTYWIMGISQANDGDFYYKIYDNLIKRYYYANASHVHLVDPQEVTPISSEVPPDQKRIEVHLAQQMVIAYEYDQPVFMTRAATGGHFSNGDFSTPKGAHIVLYKSPGHHMAAGNPAASNSYDLPGVPWISYITEDGLGFHGTYWHNDFGKPRSHGCINLTPQSARWLYRWTTPIVPADESLVFAPGGTAIEVI